MNRKIAVFSGGISPEREVSLVSGRCVAEALSKNFDVESIVLNKNEIPQSLDPKSCVIYPAMHGDYGEDGTLQGQLDAAGFTYAGCGALSSRVCMSKPAAKALMRFAGLPVARSVEFDALQKPCGIGEMFPSGAVLKPADKGSSVGMTVSKSAKDLEDSVKSLKSGFWMAEEFKTGRELSVGVIYGKAGGIVEIKPEGGVYDYTRKYTAGSTLYEFPAKMPTETELAIKSAAEKCFEVCGCRDFARIDFILTNAQECEFIILEVNTLPGMTPTSLLPKSASCIGYDFDTLCAKLMEGAFLRFDKKFHNAR